jgi:hypothetical protein
METERTHSPRRALVLFAVAFALGLTAVAMRLRAESLAEGHWEGPSPPGWHLSFSTYQMSGFLALCFATVAVISLAPVAGWFRSYVVSPILTRRPLSPAYMLFLYPLGFLAFCLSYNVPLLGRVSEALEDGLFVPAFYPFLAICEEPFLKRLANGFSGGASDYGEPYLAWLFFICFAVFVYLAARVIFWIAACANEDAEHAPSERTETPHPQGPEPVE